jgi:hypothetical protein
VLRVLLAISVLIAALLMLGAGAGVAAADPEDPSNVTEPDPATETPATSEPAPTSSTPATIFDIPQTIANQLRDMFGRPLSIFGNGRVPGTLTVPDATTPDTGTTTRKRGKPAPTVKPEPKPDPTPPEPVVPTKNSGSAVNVVLPFSPPVSVPIAPPPVPGYQNMQLTLDLTDPFKAYRSVEDTLNTVNSLLSDAYFKPAPPKPEPAPPMTTFRTFEEEPAVVDADGTDPVTPLSVGSTGSSGLPVLQAPVVVPQVRGEVPKPITGSIPPAEPPQAPTVGAAVSVRVSDVRASGTSPGSAPVEQLPPQTVLTSASAMGSPAPREGYPRYLRVARVGQLAAVALPGLAGLIAITASGGVIGYRQANSGRYLRSDAARFLQ